VQGTGVYGATALADLSESEFRSQYLGLDRSRQGVEEEESEKCRGI